MAQVNPRSGNDSFFNELIDYFFEVQWRSSVNVHSYDQGQPMI